MKSNSNKAKTPAILVNAITRDSAGLLVFIAKTSNIKILTPLYLKDNNLPKELDERIVYLYNKNFDNNSENYADLTTQNNFAITPSANKFFKNAEPQFIEVFNNIIAERQNLAESTIDYLEHALEDYDILLAMVTNEGFVHERIILEFAKKHAIPRLHANHGLILWQMSSAYKSGNCNYYASLCKEDMQLLLYDNLNNKDINAQAIGFPALDKYYLLQKNPEKFLPKNLPKDKTIITYFTSFDNTTYIRDQREDTYTRSLETGIKMANSLHANKDIFVIIKDRPTNYQFAKEKFEILLDKYSQIDKKRIIYVFEQPEPYVIASDIIVFNSSTLAIEGILAGALAININYNYADFSPSDHIPCLDNSEDIGKFILYLLANNDKLELLKNLQAKAKNLIGDMKDGLSSLRMAKYIADIIGFKETSLEIKQQIDAIKHAQLVDKTTYANLLDDKNPHAWYWRIINSLINYDQRFDIKNAYKEWQTQEKNRALMGDLMAKRMLTAWQSMPVFHLIYIVDASMYAYLAKSLAVLEYQLYKNFIVSVISTDAIPDQNLLNLPNFNWIQNPKPFAVVNDLINRVASDWIILPVADDELNFDALFYFAEYANIYSDWLAIYCDEDEKNNLTNETENLPGNLSIDDYYQKLNSNLPILKPDFNLELYRSTDYIGQTIAFKTEAVTALGGFSAMPYTQVSQLLFTLAEQMTAPAIGHISQILNHRGDISSNLLANNASLNQARAILRQQHLINCGYDQNFTITQGLKPNTYKTKFATSNLAKVSIIMEVYPSKTKKFISSILSLLTLDYKNLDIYLSLSPQLTAQDIKAINSIAEQLQAKFKVTIATMQGNNKREVLQNIISKVKTADFLCFMQSDLEIMHTNWLTELVNHFAKPEVAMIGGRIINTNGQIISAGQILGFNSDVDDIYKNFHLEQDLKGLPRLWCDQNYSALNPMGIIIRKSVYDKLQGFDMQFSDYFLFADLGIRMQLNGYRLHWTPYATSVCYMENLEYTRNRVKERQLWYKKWSDLLINDINHNKNLSMLGSGQNLSTIKTPWQSYIKQLPRLVGLGLYLHQTNLAATNAVHTIIDYLNSEEKILFAQNYTRMEEQELYLTNLLEVLRHNPDFIIFMGQPFYKNYIDHINLVKQYYPNKFIAIVSNKADVENWRANFVAIDFWFIYKNQRQNLDNLPENCAYIEITQDISLDNITEACNKPLIEEILALFNSD